MNMAIFLHVFLLLCLSVLGIPELQRCADPACKVQISEAVGIINYNTNDEEKVSFNSGDKIAVYGKTDGKYWNVEVKGKRGLVPHGFIKETRVIIKKEKLIYNVTIKVPDESAGKSDSSEGSQNTPLIGRTFDVIEGTTIFVNSSNDIPTEPLSTPDVSPSESFKQPEIDRKHLDLNVSPVRTQARKESYEVSPTKLESDDISTSAEIKYASSKDKLESSKENSDDEYQPFDKKTNEFGDTLKNQFVGGNEENGINDVKTIHEDGQPETEIGQSNYEANNDLEDSGKIKKENSGDASEEKFRDEDLDFEDINESDDNDAEQIVDGEGEGDLETVMADGIENHVDEEDVASYSKSSFEESFASIGEVSDTHKKKLKPKISELEEEPKDKYLDSTEEYDDIVPLENNLESSGSTGLYNLIPGEAEETNSSSAEPGVDENVKRDGGVLLPTTVADSPQSVELPTHELKYIEETNNSEELMQKKDTTILENDNSKALGEISDTKKFSNQELENLCTKEGSSCKEVEVDVADQISSMLRTSLNQMTLTHPPGENNDETFAESFKSDVPADFREGSTEPSFCSESMGDKGRGNIFGYSSVCNLDDMKLRNPDDGNNVDASGDEVYEKDAHPGRTGITSEELERGDIPPDNIGEPTEVQRTCDTGTSDCISNDQLVEEFSPLIDEHQGWFADYFQTPILAFLSQTMNEQNKSFGTLVYLIVTAVSVVVFTLGYYYTEKQRRDITLIAKISSLEKALMVACQEKIVLNDELENIKDKLLYVNSQSVNSDETSSLLEVELERAKNARFELEVQVASLEKELESATEAGLELNRMMSELLSAQHGSDTLLQSVEHLQHQLDSQQNTISSMNARLTAKSLENQKLQSLLSVSTTRVQTLEEQVHKVSDMLGEVQKEKVALVHEFNVKHQSIEKQLVEALESKTADSERLRRELDDLQDTLDETRDALATRECEINVLRESLKHAECLASGGESSVSLETLLNVGNLRAQVDSLMKERNDLAEKLKGEEDARKLLEDHMKIISEEVSTLRTKYEEADHGKIEAQTRLEVLSCYFREKETQLQKELGLQEAMCIQKEGDALSTNEQIKAFKEEVESYKAQNEMLKKEIMDQERSMKSQIAMLEKKAHENWVAARQAERRLEECKQEASQLRNRLTLSGRRIVGTMPGPDIGKSPDRELEYNGEMSSSPAHLGEELPSSPLRYGLPGSPPLLPPSGQIPPGPFSNMSLFLPPGAPPMPFAIPPPPGNIFPEDLRPPPLGRMSSPPPETLTSFSPFDNSPPISPLGRPYRSPMHYDDTSSSRYPQSSSSYAYSNLYSSNKWDESPRSSFMPLHRDSHEPKGSTLSSSHSSESLDKGSRHSGRV